jgi:hypothetical protein
MPWGKLTQIFINKSYSDFKAFLVIFDLLMQTPTKLIINPSICFPIDKSDVTKNSLNGH